MELIKEQADAEIVLRQLQLSQRIRKGLEKNRKEIEKRIFAII